MGNQASLSRQARTIFEEALEDCSVEHVFARKLRVTIEAGRIILLFNSEKLDLTEIRHLRIVSVGKASAAMMTGFLRLVTPFVSGCNLQGVLIAQDWPESLPEGVQFFAGGHPLPNQASFDGAKAALDLISKASTLEDALCLFLISGGASAMMELPLAADISLEDTAAFYRLLVHSGATISEINCIRKHFSAVKGGRLALAAGIVPSLTLLVSDVPSQHLDALGSGPTIPDPSTIEECRELLLRYSLEEVLPESIRAYFASSTLEETPKPGNMVPRIWTLLDSEDLGEAAARSATRLGYHVALDNTCDDWSYMEAAGYLVSQLRILAAQHRRVCLLSTGEITVSIPANMPGRAGHRGGRNQHFALYAATLLEPSDESVVVLSAGSDGMDGNSDAAGAVIGTHLFRGEEDWRKARLAIERFDSSTWLGTKGATIVTGPTGNNLRDLRILLAERPTTDDREPTR